MKAIFKKAFAPIGAIALVASIAMILTLIIVNIGTPPSTMPIVNGTDTSVKRYFLGDMIYTDKTDYYYYHGIDSSYTIIIGHLHYSSISGSIAMSNMYILLQAGSTNDFYLQDQYFIVKAYGQGWIDLQLS